MWPSLWSSIHRNSIFNHSKKSFVKTGWKFTDLAWYLSRALSRETAVKGWAKKNLSQPFVIRSSTTRMPYHQFCIEYVHCQENSIGQRAKKHGSREEESFCTSRMFFVRMMKIPFLIPREVSGYIHPYSPYYWAISIDTSLVMMREWLFLSLAPLGLVYFVRKAFYRANVQSTQKWSSESVLLKWQHFTIRRHTNIWDILDILDIYIY